MTVTYHAGRRIQGLDADRTGTQLPLGSVGGWVELGRTTLESAGDTIDVSSLADKRYYMVLADCKPSGSIQPNLRLGNSTIDTDPNYAHRRSVNGGADNTVTSTNFMQWGKNDPHNQFQVGYIANLSGNEKLFLGHNVTRMAAGATVSPERVEVVGKWDNTSNPLDIIQCYNNQAGDFASGSELVVLGWDPADTHTNNFWTELASVTNESTDTEISSGTFTSKKYLWIQAYYKGHTDVSSFDSGLRVGNTTLDSASNYSWRESTNGATDTTSTSTSRMTTAGTGYIGNGILNFYNGFIINNASNEKLIVSHIISEQTAGATTAPTRREHVGKWTNTSDQIDIIGIVRQSGTGNFAAGATIKVWGAD